MALKPIQGDVRRFAGQCGLHQSLALLDQAWNAEMGNWGKLAQIIALDRFALVVEVRSSAAMQEITLRRRELLRKLNRYFKDPLLKDLTVRMAQTHGD